MQPDPTPAPLDEAIEAATIAVHDRECPEAGWCTATPTSMARYRSLGEAAVRAAAPIIAARAVEQAEEALATVAPVNLMTALAKAEAERDLALNARDSARAGYHGALATIRTQSDHLADVKTRFADTADRFAAVEAERDELRIAKADMLAALNRLGDEVDLSEAISYMDVAECAVHAIRWHRAQAAECTCQSWPPDGPAADCAVHGAIRALNEANVELADLRSRLATAERDALNAAADAVNLEDEWLYHVARSDVADWLRERAAQKPGGSDD